MLPSLFILMFLFPVRSAHRGSPGLLCTNNLVNTVSCSWTGSPLAPGDDCWVSGVKKTWNLSELQYITQKCKMKRRGSSPPGCSFVFEHMTFVPFEVMPNISLTCNGSLIENLTNYIPNDHIKMHPPDAPHLNNTYISWTPGHPVSIFFRNTFDFHVQIKQSHQSWAESKDLFTLERTWERMPAEGLKGRLEARVRVKPANREKSHWSDWSPSTTSFVPDRPEETSNEQVWWPPLISLTATGVVLAILVVVTALYMNCHKLLKRKPVPDPSKYFETVYKGDPKKWPNPESVTESFFLAQSCDSISPVEVCGDWGVVGPSAPPSSSSTSALCHFQSAPPSGSSGVVYNSSSMSVFSNMGYFTSSSSGGSARTDPGPAYFTYNDRFHNLPSVLRPFLYDPLHSSPDYESLKREPESPDSGFGIMSQDERNDGSCIRREEVSTQSPPFRIVSLHLPAHTRPPSSSPAPPHPPSEAQVSSDSQQLDAPEAAAGGGVSAAASVSRSSSMPVEPFKTGYLTLKELQTTFSNKSI